MNERNPINQSLKHYTFSAYTISVNYHFFFVHRIFDGNRKLKLRRMNEPNPSSNRNKSDKVKRKN